MDFSESTKVVYDRIQKIDPENVSKIIGYLLLQDNGEREMIRLAFGPDNLIQFFISKAKAELGLCKPLAIPVPVLHHANSADIPMQFSPYSPSASRAVSMPSSLNLHNRMRNLSLEDQLDFIIPANSDTCGYYPMEHRYCLWPRSRRSPSLPEFPVKICHYFSKGFCKHGNTCRYFHANPAPEIIVQNCPIGYGCDDPVISQGSLEKLELELTELLKSRGGLPVSIASLPMLYYDMYGKSLQAEGYLTEGQRHGKSGLSLSKLLSRLKNSIRLLDRPHGQHSVILAEDAKIYLDCGNNDRSEPAVTISSRQIYLTFPADSTFTEQDVSNYFNKFGPVQDVRIPCQQKRMFGFVTFIFAETAKQALLKGNPHFICGSRVLVKPYKEKARLVDRKYFEKIQNLTCYSQHLLEGDGDVQSFPGCADYSKFLRKEFLEDEDHALELEQRHLMLSKSFARYSYFGLPSEQLDISQAQDEFTEIPSKERSNYFFNIVHDSSNCADKALHLSTNCSEQDSSGFNLPDSPFASASISTVM